MGGGVLLHGKFPATFSVVYALSPGPLALVGNWQQTLKETKLKDKDG